MLQRNCKTLHIARKANAFTCILSCYPWAMLASLSAEEGMSLIQEEAVYWDSQEDKMEHG